MKEHSIADHREAGQEAKRFLSQASPKEIVLSALPALTSDSRRQVEKRIGEMPVTSRKTYLTALLGKNPMVAIKAHCMECVQWDREEVKHCTGYACPLFPYRPYKKELEQ